MEQETLIGRLQALPHELDLAGQDYAETKATYKAIDEMKKTMLAGFEKRCSVEKLTQAEIARLALASDEYKQYLIGLSVAYRAYLKAEARLNAINAEIECVRSLNSIRKSEMNLV